MVRRLLILAVALAVAMAVVLPAGAAPSSAEKLTDFYTSALQGDGTFQWVHCDQATRTEKADGSAVEEYGCYLSGWVDGVTAEQGGPLPNIFSAEIVYPHKAVRFSDETGFFYFSDFLFISSGLTEVVFADTWREQLTSSGRVHFTATYAGG